MNVLSLFDGISGAQAALSKCGMKVGNYYASEIDKYAITVTQKNYPNTIQVGDVVQLNGSSLPPIDLLVGGSPCQGFSIAGKGLNFDDPRSRLFFEYARLKKETNPTWFLFENVVVNDEVNNIISECLGVKPILINSNAFSAQNRKRYFWTNIPTEGLSELPPSKEVLGDIIEPGTGKPLKIQTALRSRTVKNLKSAQQKANCLLASVYKLAQANGMTVIDDINGRRCITPREAEKLQTFPPGYTEGISDTQRYKVLGNAWTVSVIAAILSNITKESK